MVLKVAHPEQQTLRGCVSFINCLRLRDTVHKGEKCLGEPLARTDRRCNGDPRELQGTDAENHCTEEAAHGRINSWLGGCSIFVSDCYVLRFPREGIMMW